MHFCAEMQRAMSYFALVAKAKVSHALLVMVAQQLPLALPTCIFSFLFFFFVKNTLLVEKSSPECFVNDCRGSEAFSVSDPNLLPQWNDDSKLLLYIIIRLLFGGDAGKMCA